MENYLKEFWKDRNLSDSSIKLYTSNIKRLNDNIIPKNLNFLKNTDTILEKIDKYKPTTKRSYLISIVSLLKEQPKFKSTHSVYYNLMMEANKDLKINNTKSETQKENWLSQLDINKVFDELKNEINDFNMKKKLTGEEYDKLLNYFLLSLFIYQKPRRNIDYQKMYITKGAVPDGLNNDYNYLDLENNNFIFNNYKTKGTYKTQIIEIEPEMKSSIDLFLKFHPCKKYFKTKKDLIMLLVDYEGKPFPSNNTITRRLNKIFGKNIGVSMLRNIYLTDKFGKDVNELKDTSESMGTSSSTILNNYVKID